MVYKDNIVHSSIHDRVSKLLESFEWSDCSFSVLGKNFKAHKLILGISSPVFRAMLYGPMATNNDIVITDIEPDTFQLLLNYIYTDQVNITSIEQAYDLLYAAKKYLLEYLIQLCIEFIIENLSVDNIVTILNFSEFIQEEKLIEHCLKLLCEHAQFILTENLDKMTCSSMKLLLACEDINCSEKNLIKFIFEWTKHFCKSNDIPVTLDNRRKILITNGMFPLLRFSCLKHSDLQDILGDEFENVLLPDEIELIKSYFSNKFEDPKLEQKDKEICISQIMSHKIPRNVLRISWFLCHRRQLRSGPPLLIDFNNNIVEVRIKPNKSIFVNSLCVPTRMSPSVNFHYDKITVYSEQFSVSITRESDKCMIKFTNFMNTVEYDTNVCVEFPEPCLLKKDEWHKVCFTWPHNRCHFYKYIVGHRESECQNKVKFQFHDVNTDGSFLEGLKFS